MSDLGNKEIMAANIKRLMEQNNVSRSELADALHTPYTTVRDWIKGNTYPRIDKIEMMARYFGVNKSDLVERFKSWAERNAEELEAQEYIQELRDRSEMKMLFKSAKTASKDQIEAIVNLLESMKGK